MPTAPCAEGAWSSPWHPLPKRPAPSRFSRQHQWTAHSSFRCRNTQRLALFPNPAGTVPQSAHTTPLATVWLQWWGRERGVGLGCLRSQPLLVQEVQVDAVVDVGVVLGRPHVHAWDVHHLTLWHSTQGGQCQKNGKRTPEQWKTDKVSEQRQTDTSVRNRHKVPEEWKMDTTY